MFNLLFTSPAITRDDGQRIGFGEFRGSKPPGTRGEDAQICTSYDKMLLFTGGKAVKNPIGLRSKVRHSIWRK